MLKELARNSGTVAFGTALGQGAVLAATPWLARLYSPADFGALALLVSVSNIAVTVACLRYDLALPSADTSHARPLLKLAVICALSVSLATWICNSIFATSYHGELPSPFDTPLAVALCVFLAGVHQAALGWATFTREFWKVAALRFVQGAGFITLAASSSVGLVWAHTLSFFAAIPALTHLRRNNGTSALSVREAARQYKDYPTASLPGALLDVAGYSLCIWIIAAHFGASGAGQYSMVQRIIGAPLMLIGMSVGQVMLRHSADLAGDPGQMTELFRRVLQVMAVLGAVVVFLAAILGEPLFHLALGSQWRVDAMFITFVAIAVTFRACTSPLSTILITLRRFDLALRWQATYFLSAVTILWLSATQFDIGTFVIIYALHECVFYSAYLLLIKHSIRSSCAASSA